MNKILIKPEVPKIKASRFSFSTKKTVLILYIGIAIISILLALLTAPLIKSITTDKEPIENEMSEQKEIPNDVAIVAQPTNKPEILRIPILMYHYVEYVKDHNDTIRKSLDITPDIFEEQLKTLKKNGYIFITASQLNKLLDSTAKTSDKAVLLTFDDGYGDFYSDAYPILKKMNIPATIYIVVNFIGKPNFMTLNELQEINSDKLIEIGSHTLNHVNLHGMQKDKALKEISESKSQLEKIFNKPITSFAYPYGGFDKQAITLVEEAGYKNAVSTLEGNEASSLNRYYLYRLRPGNRIKDNLIQYIEQSINPLERN